MAEDGDYELLPYKELEELRSELNAIKRNPLKGYEKADDLKGSIDTLNSSIQDLIKLFSNTEDELIKNFKKDSIEAHFERLSSQNEKLAKGILAVAKLVDSHLSKQTNESSSKNSVDKTEFISQSNSSAVKNSDLTLSSQSSNEMPKLPDKPVNSPVPSLNDSNLAHPLNSSNLSIPDLNSTIPSMSNPSESVSNVPSSSSNSLPPMDMDLPPPPKKSGILGIFK